MLEDFMLCYDAGRRIAFHPQGGLHCREYKNKNCHKPPQEMLFRTFSIQDRAEECFQERWPQGIWYYTKERWHLLLKLLTTINTHLVKTHNQENISLRVLENRDLDLLYLRLYLMATTGQHKIQTASSISVLLNQTENHIINQIHRAWGCQNI